MKSKRCNVESGYSQCPKCKRLYPGLNKETTSPTSTEVEEVATGLWAMYGKAGTMGDFVQDATQAITSLIQQAELRGRIDEVRYAWNRSPKDETLKPTDPVTAYLEKRLAELQAQLTEGRE